MASTHIIDPHGGYRRLKSYQMAEIVYDATVHFCNRWVSRRSRTHDQMVQAAFLLDRQLEERFLEHGGFTEKLYRARIRARKRF